MPVSHAVGSSASYTGPYAWLADPSLAPGAAGTVTGHCSAADTTVTPNEYTFTWDLGATSPPAPPPAVSVFKTTDAEYANVS